MYHVRDAGQRQSATRWLEGLQNGQDGWTMAVDVLGRAAVDGQPAESNELTFFAAQTLKHKLESDYAQLEQGAPEAIMGLLRAAIPRQSNRALRTQLLLALTALFVQCRAVGRGTVDEVIGQFGGRIALELLCLLPEQLDNRMIVLSEEGRRERRAELIEGPSEHVLSLFISTYTGSVGNAELQSCCAEGLQNWTRYAALNTAQAIHILHIACQMLKDAVEQSTTVLTPATEIIADLAYQHRQDTAFLTAFFGDGGQGSIMGMVISILGSALGAEEEEAVKAVGTMLIEVAEGSVEFLLHNPPSLNALIPMLLRLSGYQDLGLVELTFSFWASLEMLLEEAPDEVHDAFIPVYLHLLRILLPRCQFPLVEVSAEERDAFRDFRHLIGDCLKDCVRVVGSSTAISVIQEGLHSASSGPWQQSEAFLFGLRAVSSVLERRESEVLPSLFPDLLARYRHHPRHIYAVLLIIGCLADWIRYHPEHLSPAIEFIVAGLAGGGPQDASITAAASTAIKYLCESCSRLLKHHLDALCAVYRECRARLPGRDQVSVAEAICHVLVEVAEGDGTGSDSSSDADLFSVLKAALPKALEPVLLSLQSPATATQAANDLEQAALFVDLVVPPSASMSTAAHPMVAAYLASIEPTVLPLAGRFGQAVDEALGEVLRAAVIRYTRGLGGEWCRRALSMAVALRQAGLTVAPFQMLRYFIIMGEVPEPVRPLILEAVQVPGFIDGSSDSLQLITAMLDYHSETLPFYTDIVMQRILPGILGDSTVATPDLNAALQVLQRVVSRFGGRNVGLVVPLVAQAIAAGLAFYPATVLADVAVLLHRLHRIDPAAALHATQSALSTIPESIVTGRERQVWLDQQYRPAVMEERPKGLRTLLSSWSAAVRRRQAN